MPPPVEDWCAFMLEYWRRHGLSDEQARDCLSEAFLRYRRKRGLPAWGMGEPPPALWVIARDLLCEHWRRRSREQKQVEQLQAQYRCRCEQFCDDEPEAQTFQLSLPPRLNEVLTLRLEGYTCREIAERLAIAVGTVKSYLAELRQKFRDFYGYDPTKRPSQGGYINGNASEVSTPHGKEDISNASTHRSGHGGGSASGGKRVRPAAHSRRARRRGGGGGFRKPDAG